MGPILMLDTIIINFKGWLKIPLNFFLPGDLLGLRPPPLFRRPERVLPDAPGGPAAARGGQGEGARWGNTFISRHFKICLKFKWIFILRSLFGGGGLLQEGLPAQVERGSHMVNIFLRYIAQIFFIKTLGEYYFQGRTEVFQSRLRKLLKNKFVYFLLAFWIFFKKAGFHFISHKLIKQCLFQGFLRPWVPPLRGLSASEIGLVCGVGGDQQQFGFRRRGGSEEGISGG